MDVIRDITQEKDVSVERACRVMKISRCMFYYKSKRDDSLVENKLSQLAEKFPTKGFSDYQGRIRNEGLKWNHKKVYRIYKKLGLNMRRKKKRRIMDRIKQPLFVPMKMNQTWSMDFMHDSLESGRKFRVFNLIDDFNRESLCQFSEYSISGERITRALEEVIEWRGKPEEIRSDNGPEFLSNAYRHFCDKNGIKIKYIQPGKPTQNAYVERFNRLFRRDVLDAHIFSTMKDVNMVIEEWQEDYNEFHPHKSLKKMSPKKYLEAVNCGKLIPAQTTSKFTTIDSYNDNNKNKY